MKLAAAGLLAMTMAADAGEGWTDLPGWQSDDHGAALAAFLVTCDLVPDLRPLCEAAAVATDPRAFFETHFRPVPAIEAFFTGYYEPEFAGSRHREGAFVHPVHAMPPGVPAAARGDLRRSGQLAGHELAWLSDPLDAFFLQVQGSGRIRLPDGGVLRLAYAGRNGQPYRSIGKVLVERGEIAAEALTAPAIREWAAAHPGQVADLLDENPSYVFFRQLSRAEGVSGPIGAMGRSVSAGRSVAVDPGHVPLGLPVWVEKPLGAGPMRRLMMAQDTGSAIRGPGRADIFYGSGSAAGEVAGLVRDRGRMTVLVPLGWEP